MVDLYFTLIVNHMRTLSQVPTELQRAVQTKLSTAGLDGNGDPIVTADTSQDSTTWATT